MDVKVAITVNKSDYWFCKICVASVRYFYPDVPVYIIKDELKGAFSTAELEDNWNVQVIELAQKKFGWSAAKIHFYADERFAGQKFLVLDADIVFLGKILDKFADIIDKNDFIVSPEPSDEPYTDWVTRTYFDVKKVEGEYQHYKFPGYFFNCGQMFVRMGALTKKDAEPFFDFDHYPYWKNLQQFPLVDQSMLNFLLPLMSNEGKIKLVHNEPYMLWSESPDLKISTEDLKSGKCGPYLLHWAGAVRNSHTKIMSHSNVLAFFEDFYYSKIPGGKQKQAARYVSNYLNYISRQTGSSLKKSARKILGR